MIKFRLENDMVVGLPETVAQDYQPKANEIVVEQLPHVSLKDNQRAYIYYRNGQIEYEIKER